MIVFNALAIVVGIIIGIFLGPLYWLAPKFMETTWGSVLACAIVTGVSVICDLVGLKGRVFWLPIWLFGLIGVGVNLHTQWGWYGPALAGGLVVAMIGGLLAMGALAERKAWAEAPGNLNAARELLSKGVSDETWALLSKAYFVPSWGDETPERCRHNLEVLAAARTALPQNPTGLVVRVFDALGAAYRTGLDGGGRKPSIPAEFTSAMQQILEAKGVLSTADDHKALIEALDKPLAAPS